MWRLNKFCSSEFPIRLISPQQLWQAMVGSSFNSLHRTGTSWLKYSGQVIVLECNSHSLEMVHAAETRTCSLESSRQWSKEAKDSFMTLLNLEGLGPSSIELNTMQAPLRDLQSIDWRFSLIRVLGSATCRSLVSCMTEESVEAQALLTSHSSIHSLILVMCVKSRVMSSSEYEIRTPFTGLRGCGFSHRLSSICARMSQISMAKTTTLSVSVLIVLNVKVEMSVMWIDKYS